MATIAVVCPNCGDVEVTQREVVVMVCRNNAEGSYSLTCPACTELVTRRAEPRIVELLVAAGCRLKTWTLPVELADKQRSGDEPPIGIDEEIDFHEQVQDEGAFDKAFGKLCGEVE